MRATLLLPSLLGLCSTGLAQVSPALTTTTLLSGHLDQAPNGDSVRLWVGAHRLKAPVSSTGDFQLAVTGLAQAEFVDFSYAQQRTPLYLTPGDQLRLTLDYPHFDESLRFSGRGADANNYLVQSRWKFEEGIPLRPQDKWTATTTPAQARQEADAYRADQLAFLATYSQQHPLPIAIQQEATAHITLLWVRLLLRYPAEHVRLAQVAPSLPSDYYAFLRQLPATTFDKGSDRTPDDRALVSTSLQAYGYRLAPTGSLDLDPAVGERLYAQATADLGDTPTRDQAVYRLLGGQLATNLAGVLAAYPAFRAHNRDSVAAKGLRKGIRSIGATQRIQPGQAAPAFSLVDAAGHPVALPDFKGKVVYLDFWGTWCGPCLAEMPASQQLRQHFAGRDVVFVYISVNDSPVKWRQMLTARKLDTFQAVHLWSPNVNTAQAYLVAEYPTYYLIGRDGRFVSIRPPRPSNKTEAIAAIEQALLR